ncbi:MAG: FHA domain-containing protein [bacterium]|nr:FHA domain-containing protein [bacterium]
MSSPLVKYCPLCGAENSRLAPFCAGCGDADLSTVPVEPVRAPAPAADGGETRRVEVDTCVLELLADPRVSFAVRAGQTVGRTGRSDIVLVGVPDLDCISAVHARFLKRGDQWYVQHLGQTNFIQVDGETYKGSEEVAIYPDSVLALSLSTFRVRWPA